MRARVLRYADNSADLERRGVGENVVPIHHTPLVTARRGAQVGLAVVDSIAAIPILAPDGRALLPFPVFDVSVIIAMVAIVMVLVSVMVLGKCGATRQTGGKDCER